MASGAPDIRTPSADGITDDQKSRIRNILEQAEADEASLADTLTLIEFVLSSQ